MTSFRNILGALLAAGSFAAAPAAIVTENVSYTLGDTTMIGFVAYDDEIEGARPGVLVVHQWKGLTDYERGRARQLAEMGYVAFCADIYGGGVNPPAPTESGKMAGRFKGDRALFRQRLAAGLEQLKANPRTDANRLGVIGYCFGGTGALELARSGADVDIAVSFHGNLDTPTPADAANIRGSVLVLHGADDPVVPPAEVEAFHAEMRQGRVDYQVVAYGGAVHSFTEKGAGDRYNEKADRRSWTAMQAAFDEAFAQPGE